ncbi:uncharacterized protein BJX67DRAFT_367120 [Aspergillus lucknowensis]|uniref:Uncharacterized protein n=1 Tax=Aspergillus lucknowensis TaxID=176173 RepID=A0ABR4L9C6_9EURO
MHLPNLQNALHWRDSALPTIPCNGDIEASISDNPPRPTSDGTIIAARKPANFPIQLYDDRPVRILEQELWSTATLCPSPGELSSRTAHRIWWLGAPLPDQRSRELGGLCDNGVLESQDEGCGAENYPHGRAPCLHETPHRRTSTLVHLTHMIERLACPRTKA